MPGIIKHLGAVFMKKINYFYSVPVDIIRLWVSEQNISKRDTCIKF